MAHRDNLGSILEHGILSHAEIAHRGLARVDISDPQVQARRAAREPVFGRRIHEYVPLYLNPRNPMLYRWRHLQRELVILVVSAEAVRESDGVLFTDGNAASDATLFSSDEAVIEGSRPVLQATWWNQWPDGKRRRCAEALLPQRLLPSDITEVACNNSWLARHLSGCLDARVVVDPLLFF